MGISIAFELPFRILTKKNSKVIARFKNGGSAIVSRKEFVEFEEMAIEYLGYVVMPKIKKLPKPPYKASYDIYFKGKLSADLDNLIATINDVMEGAGLIENDKYIVEYVSPTKFTNCYPTFTAKVVLEGQE